MSISAAVLDIEGTTGSIDYVRLRLFPYSRARISSWLAEHRGDADARKVIEGVRAATGASEEEAVAEQLRDWIDRDIKAEPLKYAQGLIWHEGFTSGELRGHVYPDVPPALTAWRERGVLVYIYSSGSVAAQRDWFGHTEFGDLTHFLDGYFDLSNAGGKKDAESYRKISAEIGAAPDETVFLSDVAAELDAAAAAGWATIGVIRDGNSGTAADNHRWITSFEGLDLPELDTAG